MGPISIHSSASHGSRFDWVVSGCANGPLPTFDEPLLMDDRAVAIPSVGSLVPGWVLIVPRQRAVSLGAMTAPARGELHQIRKRVVETLVGQWSERVFEFEHGPSTFGSLTGCGVDQAHVHLAPLPFDLVEAASNDLQLVGVRFDGDVADPWTLTSARRDYLLVRDVATGAGVVLTPHTPESQALRKLIATKLGRSADWNYRLHEGTDNVIATRDAFRGGRTGV